MAKKKTVTAQPKLKRPTRLIDQYRFNRKSNCLEKYQVEVPINFEWENEIIPVEKNDTVEKIHTQEGTGEFSLRDKPETTEGITEDERDGGIPD